MNQQEAQTLVSFLVHGFPGARFTTENAEVYESAIIDLDPREAQAAVESIIRGAGRFPYPNAIRDEVNRARAERTRLEESARARRAIRGPIGLQSPSAGQWGAVLPAMLEADARHRRMMRAWRKRKGLDPREEDACPFLAMAERGAKGDDVLGIARKLLAPMGLGGGR